MKSFLIMPFFLLLSFSALAQEDQENSDALMCARLGLACANKMIHIQAQQLPEETAIQFKPCVIFQKCHPENPVLLAQLSRCLAKTSPKERTISCFASQSRCLLDISNKQHVYPSGPYANQWTRNCDNFEKCNGYPGQMIECLRQSLAQQQEEQ